MDVDFSIDKNGKVTYRISEQTDSCESMMTNGITSTNHYLSRIPQTVDPTMLNIWGLNQSSFNNAVKLSANENANNVSQQPSAMLGSRLVSNPPSTSGGFGNEKLATHNVQTVHVLERKNPGNTKKMNTENDVNRGQGDASSSNFHASQPLSPAPSKKETAETSKRYTNFASMHKHSSAKLKPDSNRNAVVRSSGEHKDEGKTDSQRSLREIFAERTGTVTFKSNSSKDWVVRTSVLRKGTAVHRAHEPSSSQNEQSVSKTQFSGKLESVNANKQVTEAGKSIKIPYDKESSLVSNGSYPSEFALERSTKIDTVEPQVSTETSNLAQNRNNSNALPNSEVSSYMSQRTIDLCKNDPYLASLLLEASKVSNGAKASKSESTGNSHNKTNQKSQADVDNKTLRTSLDSNKKTVSENCITSSLDGNLLSPKRSSVVSSHTNNETIFHRVSPQEFHEQKYWKDKSKTQTWNVGIVDQDLKLENDHLLKTENIMDDGPLTYRPIGRTVTNLLRDSLDSCEEEGNRPPSVKDRIEESKSKIESNNDENANEEEVINKKQDHHVLDSPIPKTPSSGGRKVTFRDRLSSDSSNFSDSVYGIPKRKPNDKKVEGSLLSKVKSSDSTSSRSKSEEKLIAQAAVIGKSIKTDQVRKVSDSSDGEFEKFWNVSLEEWKKLSPYQKYLKYKKMTSAQKDEMYLNSASKLGLLDSDSDAVALVSRKNDWNPAPKKVNTKREELKLLYPKKTKKEKNSSSNRAVPVPSKFTTSTLPNVEKEAKEIVGKGISRNAPGSSQKKLIQVSDDDDDDDDDDDRLLSRDKETFRSGSFDKLVEGFLFSSEVRKSHIEDDKLDTRLNSPNCLTKMETDSQTSNDLNKREIKSRASTTLNARVSNGNTGKQIVNLAEKDAKKAPQNELPTEREETPAWSEPFPDSLILETYRPDDDIDDDLNEDSKANVTNVSLSTFMPETRRSISEAFKQLPVENVDFDETTGNDQFSEFVFLCRNNALSTRCETADAEAETLNGTAESNGTVFNEKIEGNPIGSLGLEATSCDSLIDSLYGEPHVEITPVRYIGSHAKRHLESQTVAEVLSSKASNSMLPDDGLTFKQFLTGEESTGNDCRTLEDFDKFVVSKFGGQTVRDMTEERLVSRSLLLESVDAEGQAGPFQTTYLQSYFAQPANFKKVTEDKGGSRKTSSERRKSKAERRQSSRSPNPARRARSSSRSPRSSKAKAISTQNQLNNVSAVQSRNPQTRSVDVARGSATNETNEKRKSGVPQNARTGPVGSKQQGLNDKVTNARHAANIAVQLQRNFPQNIVKRSRVGEEVSGVVAASNAVTVKEAPKIHDKTAQNTPSPQLYPNESGLSMSAAVQPLATGGKPNLRNKGMSPQLVRPSSARQKRKRALKGLDANRLQAQDTPCRSMSPAVNSRSYNSSRSSSPNRSNVSGDPMPPLSFSSGKPVTREEHFTQYLQELHASLAQRNMLTTSPTMSMLSSASTREICGDLLATPKEKKGPSKTMWLTLPTEMWLFIMSFLEPRDLNYLGLTCKKLKSLAFDFTLWSSVTVSKKTLKPPHLKSIVSLNPTCVSFLQCDFDGIKDQNLREFFRSLRGSLQELNIVGCNSKECNANSILVHAGTRCPKMINLDTSWSNLNPHTLVAFSEYVDTLESLSLNGCSAINDDCINKLMEKYGESLKKMYLYGCYKLDLSLKSMSNVLPNLQVIHLGNVPLVTDEILHKFATSLRDLREVDVRSNKNITDEGIYNLAFYCRRLMVLIIPNCPQISNFALHHLGGYCMNLSVLDLDGCSKISDEGVEKLICGTRVLIQKLGLSSTGITSASCKMIEENCAKLQEVKFSFCHAKISVDALRSLAESKPNLLTIHLYGFDKSRVRKALKGVNKNLKINI